MQNGGRGPWESAGVQQKAFCSAAVMSVLPCWPNAERSSHVSQRGHRIESPLIKAFCFSVTDSGWKLSVKVGMFPLTCWVPGGVGTEINSWNLTDDSMSLTDGRAAGGLVSFLSDLLSFWHVFLQTGLFPQMYLLMWNSWDQKIKHRLNSVQRRGDVRVRRTETTQRCINDVPS